MLEKTKITITLDVQTLELLGFMAEKNKTSRSQMIRRLIMENSSYNEQEEVVAYANRQKNKMD